MIAKVLSLSCSSHGVPSSQQQAVCCHKCPYAYARIDKERQKVKKNQCFHIPEKICQVPCTPLRPAVSPSPLSNRLLHPSSRQLAPTSVPRCAATPSKQYLACCGCGLTLGTHAGLRRKYNLWLSSCHLRWVGTLLGQNVKSHAWYAFHNQTKNLAKKKNGSC